MSSHEQPKVSIITINYKQAEITIALLESLRKITYSNVEVIVVDNDSGGEDIQKIEHAAPWVNVVASPSNLGFAGGNNLGLTYASGELILFINNDVEVPTDFLEPLVIAIQEPKVGLASPKIIFYYKPNTIQYAGSTPLNYLTMRNKAIGFTEEDHGQYNEPRSTAFAHGAAMITRREVIDKVGTMYDGYFLYYEELDWCERIKKAGYSIEYVPSSKIFHKESISTGKQSPLKTYYINRNRLLFLRRNTTGVIRLAGIAYFLGVAFPKRLLQTIIHNEKQHRKALVRSLLWHLNPSKYEYHS